MWVRNVDFTPFQKSTSVFLAHVYMVTHVLIQTMAINANVDKPFLEVTVKSSVSLYCNS